MENRITASASGIKLAIARGFVSEGAKVFIRIESEKGNFLPVST